MHEHLFEHVSFSAVMQVLSRGRGGRGRARRIVQRRAEHDAMRRVSLQSQHQHDIA